MHYLFLDESYHDVIAGRTIVIAAWAAEQRRLNDRVLRLHELLKPGKASILERLDSALESLDALALVAWATLDESLFRYGERDGTDDIKDMGRPDNIWSVSIGFAVASLIVQLTLMRQHIDIDTVDVYFDPKSLKRDHATALEKVLRDNVVSEARRYGAQRGVNLLKNLKIRRIQPVKKPKNDEAPDKFQMGTWVSDRLCSKSDEIRETGGTSRIKTHDMSDVVKRTVQPFDGKSFYDS